MKVKVKPGWQLGIEGEKVYQPGEVVNVPDALAQQWIAAGQATAVKGEKAAPKPKAKAVKAAKNKAVKSSANKGFVSVPEVADKPVVLPSQR